MSKTHIRQICGNCDDIGILATDTISVIESDGHSVTSISYAIDRDSTHWVMIAWKEHVTRNADMLEKEKQFLDSKSEFESRAGSTLKLLRKKRGLSQGELGKRIGAIDTTISFWERTGRIDGYTAKKLAKFFEVSPSEFNRLA